MSSVRTAILRTFIFLTLIYSMAAGIYYSRAVFRNYSKHMRDYVADWESRLVDLKKGIPANEEKIGYISDWDRRTTQKLDKDAYIEFILTQYSLAPVRLARDPNLEWVIINSHADDFLDWFASRVSETYTIQNFGGGIYLIHKEGE